MKDQINQTIENLQAIAVGIDEYDDLTDRIAGLKAHHDAAKKKLVSVQAELTSGEVALAKEKVTVLKTYERRIFEKEQELVALNGHLEHAKAELASVLADIAKFKKQAEQLSSDVIKAKRAVA